MLHNTKHSSIIHFMSKFGETIRDLRLAKDLGLRETAVKVGMSPAYLSRIERGKEGPPSPEMIKALASYLAADPDVLFRLSASTDPEVVEFLHSSPEVMSLVRFLTDASFSSKQIEELMKAAQKISSDGIKPKRGRKKAKPESSEAVS